MPEQKRKILISPTSFGECGPEPVALLKDKGLELVYNSLGRRLTGPEVVQMGADCVGLIAGVEPLTAEVLEKLPRLKCISRCGVGMENVDLEAAKRLGIKVMNTPDAPTQSVAELTMGLMISLLRKVTIANSNFHAGQWKKETGFLLSGKAVGILGMGRIGRKVIELLQPFGCRVSGHDLHPDRIWLKDHRVQLVSLQELIEQNDIVTIHVSHPAQDSPLIGKNELARMKKGSWLINLSRGNVIDEAALYESLVSGQLAGAALDVFDQEPYNGALCGLQNIIGTPHMGSYAQEAKRQMEIEAAENLLKALTNGNEPH